MVLTIFLLLLGTAGFLSRKISVSLQPPFLATVFPSARLERSDLRRKHGAEDASCMLGMSKTISLGKWNGGVGWRIYLTAMAPSSDTLCTWRCVLGHRDLLRLCRGCRRWDRRPPNLEEKRGHWDSPSLWTEGVGECRLAVSCLRGRCDLAGRRMTSLGRTSPMIRRGRETDADN